MKYSTEHKAFLRGENNARTRAGRGPRILRLGVALALSVATVASAQSYRVLKSLAYSDGAQPMSKLVLAGSTLYGTGRYGGDLNNGVVFKVNTDGSGFAVLKSFSGSDGFNPSGDLVLGGSTLYGTTQWGGSFYTPTDLGYGVIFKVNTDGSGFAVLKSLTGSAADCRGAGAGLVLAGSTLYGTTGGDNWLDHGTVFTINTDGSGFAVLKRFTGSASDGAWPHADLVMADGVLYGTTLRGGSSDSGVVFKVNTDGSGYAALKDFGSSGSDGNGPWGGLALAGSTLYGTTYWGGTSGLGVVFRVNTDGSGFAVLKHFTGSDGRNPTAGLVLAGSTLYGTAGSGGSSSNGVVFRVNTDGSGFAVLKNFTGSDGGGPYAGLTLAGSTLYGTTVGGGSSGYGVVFSGACLSIIKPPLTQTAEGGTTVRFQVGAAGWTSLAYQWLFDGTNALAGSTNAFLELPNIQPAQAGAYTVVVTNLAEGAVTSAPALLSVIPPVDRRVVPALHLTGTAGSLLHVEYADNLATPQWFSLSDVTLSGGPEFCFDFSSALPAQRFYRAWTTNGPPPSLDASMATEILLAGAVGSSVRVDYINQFGPTDAWVTLDTVTLTNTTQLYYDLTAFGQPARLYRLVAVP